MASKNSTTSFDDLPEESAVDIFLRLPVKDLIRSTSVNKNWYSLITNPNFISAQIKRAISHCYDNAVLIIPPCDISEGKHCSLISAETSKLIKEYEVPFSTRSNTLKLVGSVDGLMLLTDLDLFYSCRDLYLWNPCVGTHRGLISGCFKELVDNMYMSCCVVGVGFSRSRGDYRVVRIVYVWDRNMNFWGEVAPKAEVYSLRKQTWRKIKEPGVTRVASNEGVYVKGCCYWLEIQSPSTQVMGRPYNCKDLWILSFDFDSEVFGEVKVPETVSGCLSVNARFKLMEFEGSLALCVSDLQVINGVTTDAYRLWLMRQENGIISWNLRFSAELKEGGVLINITKAGTVLIETYPLPYCSNVTSILSCNLKTMHYKDLGFGRCGGADGYLLMPDPCTVDASFMESLVMYEGGKALLKFA